MIFLRHFFRFFVFVIAMDIVAVAWGQDSQEKRGPDLPIVDSFQKDKPQVETVADSLEYSREQSKVIARDHVVIRYQNTELTADYAEVETTTKKAYARGHVIVFQSGKETTKTTEIYYDFENSTASLPESRFASPPWYASGKDIQQIQKGVKVICDGSFSSCNMEEPYYSFRAKKITIYENSKLIARDVTIYVHNTPVFWLPYMAVPLDWPDIPISVSAGYSARYGYYAEVTKNLTFTPEISGKLHTDFRSLRGVGAGLDVNYDYGKFARGIVETYITQDKRAPSPNAPNPFDELRNRTRGRVQVRHRTDFDPYSNLILRFNRISDEYFLQEFFRKEYHAEVEPQSFITFTKNSDRYGFFVNAQKKMNSFEAVVERLPELRFDWKNQEINLPKIPPGVFYESQTSYANLYKSYGRIPLSEAVSRGDTFHEVSLPKNWRDIKITPFSNFRGTLYSRNRWNDHSKFRTTAGWGTDLRTQAYKTYPVVFDKLGLEVNQLRHVLEPSVQYHSILTTIGRTNFDYFDSKDRIDDAHVIKFGVENRFQTKRVVNGRLQKVDLISLNTFLSFEFRPNGLTQTGVFAPFEDDYLTKSAFSILSQEVVFRPYNWLQYELRADYDIRVNKMRSMTNDIRLQAGKGRLIFGQRMTQAAQANNEGGNQFVFDGSYTINPLWDIGGYVRWNAHNNKLEEWQVMATRNLACDLVFNFGYNVRNSDIQTNNNTLFFEFYLRPFRDLTLKAGGNRASFGEPRIGDTVAGSNQAFTRTPFRFDNLDQSGPPVPA